MRRCLYWFSLTLGVLLMTHAARADDSFTFSTDPDPGDVSGPAGTTVRSGAIRSQTIVRRNIYG